MSTPLPHMGWSKAAGEAGRFGHKKRGTRQPPSPSPSIRGSKYSPKRTHLQTVIRSRYYSSKPPFCVESLRMPPCCCQRVGPKPDRRSPSHYVRPTAGHVGDSNGKGLKNAFLTPRSSAGPCGLRSSTSSVKECHLLDTRVKGSEQFYLSGADRDSRSSITRRLCTRSQKMPIDSTQSGDSVRNMLFRSRD
jgi:hypothetical protein